MNIWRQFAASVLVLSLFLSVGCKKKKAQLPPQAQAPTISVPVPDEISEATPPPSPEPKQEAHYGQLDKFGLTRKPFRTPLGDCQTDTRLVDWLAQRGGRAVEMEDYCHSFEHTVEFQTIFLQHTMGPQVRILDR